MLDLIAAFWFGVIGACIGSFLNVVAYRMPRGMSVVWKPSHCPSCGHAIRARDNIPVLGWLLLRGRCRDCGSPFSPRYAIVEAVTGAAFAVLAYFELLSGGANLPGGPLVADYGAAALIARPDWQLIGLFFYHAILLSLLMAIVLIDLDGARAPRSFALLALVLVAIASTHHAAWYPNRTVPGSDTLLSPPADALAGAAFGAGPWLLAYAVARRRGRTDHVATHANLALALGMIGGFLGLRAAVAITLAWAPTLLAARALKRTRHPLRLAATWPLWPLTLANIVLWKQVAEIF